ncbi:EamA family transporter [Leucobacter sp. USHLN153]|uniref:EamA family transporter n=1 Tax=Leucobacter sp. USHLN153 TaxID=3081268 RepID=UPI003019EC86
MFLIQLSSALSVGLIAEVGPATTSWLRLLMGGLIFIAIARPKLRSIRRDDALPLIGLGAASALMSVAFLAAVDRIPLGTAVAIEFLGPLTVAAIRSHSRRALAWPFLALAGVVLLTEPWHGAVDLGGIAFALLAGVGWGSYILLTQRVGDRFPGISGLAVTIPIAAVCSAVVGVPGLVANFEWRFLLIALGLAVLAPVLPFWLEMSALRRMTPAAFGTLMAVEPAVGMLLGAIVLGQLPSAIQLTGVALVVLAGAAAQRGGSREVAGDPDVAPLSPEHLEDPDDPDRPSNPEPPAHPETPDADRPKDYE